MKKINPIFLIFLVLTIWFILAYICAGTIQGYPGEEMTLVILLYSFYIAPIVGIVTWIIGLLLNKEWLKNNKTTVIIFSLLLVIWIIFIIYYIFSLFD